MKHLCHMCILALLLMLSAFTANAAVPTPTRVEDQAITTTGEHKLPSPAAGNGRIYVAWSLPNAAKFAERDELSGNFATANLGSVGSNSSYFNAATAVSSDGTVHYAWIDSGRFVRHRNKSLNQGWSVEHVVAISENFANAISIAVRGSEVYLSWRHQGADPSGYIRIAYSANKGESWPIVRDIPTPTGTYAGRPSLSANGMSNVLLTWTGTDGNVYVGEGSAQNFTTTCITCSAGTRNDFFNPTIASGPDGQAYLAWRSVTRGVFYARRSSSTWSMINIFPHREVVGPVKIAVDSQSNIHLAWISKQSGAFDTWYAVKTTTTSFSAPIAISGDGGAFKANLDMAVSIRPEYTTAHIFYESFAGGQGIRYARVRTNDIGCFGSSSGALGVGTDASGLVAPVDDGRATGLSRQAYIPVAMAGAPPTSC